MTCNVTNVDYCRVTRNSSWRLSQKMCSKVALFAGSSPETVLDWSNDPSAARTRTWSAVGKRVRIVSDE